MNIHPVRGAYHLSATGGDLGDWQLGIRLREQERRTLNITLKQAVSIEGRLLMLDDITPHVAVSVQAIRDEEVIDTTFSDERGRYCFINLKPGRYQVQCQVLGGYVYYGQDGKEAKGQRGNGFDTQAAGLSAEGGAGLSRAKPVSKLSKPTQPKPQYGETLQVEKDKKLSGIDFCFAPFKKGTWKNYSSLDGLAHNDVFAIYEDPDGMMWFGTQGGVSRYDGKEFVNLTTKNGLVHNCVTAIHRDSDGAMWFGTNEGVSHYDGKKFVNFTTDDGLVNNRVRAIHRANVDELWFGTYDGVSRYDGEGFVTFNAHDGLPGNFITAMNGGADGVMWFGTTLGLCRYDGKRFVSFTTKDGLPHNYVSHIYLDHEGVLWVGTHGGVAREVYPEERRDGKQFVSLTTKDGLLISGILAIYIDLDDVVWFGTWSGVCRYDGKAFVNFTTEDGLGDNGIRAIHRGSDGTMWFGTPRGGVSRYNEDEFITFTTKDGLANDDVHAIHRDSDGIMWLGTGGGLFRYDEKTFVSFTPGDGLVNRINVIYREPDGVIWFGGRWEGISRYDGENIVNFTSDDVLPHNYVYAIHRTHDGVIWFGTGWATGGGATRYDGKEFVTFTTQDGLVGNTVYAICEEPHGALWFGTDCGLSCYDGRKFVNFTTKEGLVNNSVSVIHRNPDGVMWFGTGGGISRYDGKKFANFTTQDGLAHDFITTIYRDPDDVLWFGTDGGGVCMYDGTAWSSLDSRDGLAGNSVRSIDPAPDGSLWFGTNGGLTRYRRSSIPPRVRIASVKIDGEYTELEGISFITVGNHIVIEYSAIDFKTVPEKRQYRCRIVEIDSDWRGKPKASVGFDTQATQPKAFGRPTKAAQFEWIPRKAGTYTFQVQAIGRDLNYSKPATLSLTVQPDPVLVSMQTEINHLRREAGQKYHFENIIGHSDGIRQVHALMTRAIDSGLTVLIIGETGTGKELVAKAIHYHSPRKDYPLLELNCGAVPKDLVASTLFGHRKGAFTGASEDKMGLFEAASRGTLLLDEIGEMPQDAQVHLLRVLEEHKIQRLGEENISRDVDVRIIAMTNRDLFKEVEAGRFREDLYYRVSEFPIHIPPLRERPEDITLLAEHFLQEIDKELDGFAPDVFEMLQSYAWPGNVRELRNVIRRAAAFVEEGKQIQAYHFPPQITQGESLIQAIISEQVGLSASLNRLQRRLIEDALKKCDGNRTHAARMLKIDRSNLIRLMRRLDIK